MRTLTKILVPSLLAGGVLLPASVRAQPVDVQPPMPNVLIMLDTSGSMSRKMGSDEFPDCSLTGDAAKTDLDDSRWFAVVQALTGEIDAPYIGCRAMPRTGEPFDDLYGDAIYDRGYYIPFYQLQSGGCAYVPRKDDWDKKWHEFKDNDIVLRQWPFDSNDSCDWRQNSDGIIDAYKGLVRFGLMTFDPLVDPRVEIDNGNSERTDSDEGSKGTYSYWFSTANDWKGTTAARAGSWKDDDHAGHAVGKPVLCEADQDMEVGARGPAAPPWEGRLMGFGHYRAPAEDVRRQNENVEKVVLTARPFGATPLAGMFADAADFILNDDTMYDPKGNDRDVPLGPKDDDLWQQGEGCRPFHVILITDGEPNLDLLPDCVQRGDDDGDGDVDADDNDPSNDGACPFPSIVDSDLYPGHSGEVSSTVNILAREHGIKFHVVGVSLNEVTDAGAAHDDCADYRTGGDGEDRCGDPDATAQEKTCCLLNAIAEVGGSEQAYFASSTGEVKDVLKLVLEALAEGTASRTTPVYQSVAPTFYVEDTDASAIGHEILSSLKTTVGSGMWNGRLERVRFSCVPGPLPERATFTRELGDDFDDNLANDPGSRFMFTVVPTNDRTETWRTIRPNISTADAADDQVGEVAATTVAGAASTWVSAVPFEALEPTNADCRENFGTEDEAACRTQLLSWYTGLPSDAEIDRIPSSNPLEKDNSPSPMGAIYHSQPVIVGPPREFVRDESYDVFAVQHAARPTVVYAATIDGQLHAFLLGDNTGRLDEHEDFQADRLERNELWSFVPPIVLPYLNRHVNEHALLLDGGITVKNIAFERTADALAGSVAAYVDAVNYRTAMVVSSGNASSIPGGGYYFALDVTDPHPDPEDFDGDEDVGPRFEAPKFLWQLSRDDAADGVDDEGGGDDDDGDDDGNDNPTSLFGEALPAAAITSIAYVDPSAPDAPPREIAVAILAGGRSQAPENVAYEDFQYEAFELFDGPAELAPRSEVRRWGDSRADRSLTIVRLDTGEILRRFIGQASDPRGAADDRITPVGFWAPISGTPVAFPGLPGQVSSRVFVGDAEGMLWEVDLTNPNPDDWTMKVAWDPYRDVTRDDLEDDEDPYVIGPVETVPVVSVDDVGDPVVIFATGSQESFYQNTGTNFVVSIRDSPAEEGYELNWELDLENTPDLGSAVFQQDPPMTTSFGAPGQRVTGPINIFDGVVYFSTFVPSGEACEVGTSRVWGVHYLRADEQDRPVAAWNPDNSEGDDYFDQDDSAIVFGVAIGQQPSCRDTSVETINDPIFGSYSTFDASPPGQFELVVQTGRRIGGATPPAGKPSTRTTSWTLKPPVSSVRVDGWASIVE